MKLIRFEAEGFGIFKDKKVFDFENDINLICAENGSGKSTMIQGIEILLLSNYEGSFSDYMNRDCDEFTISLEFMLDKYHLLETLVCKKGKTYTTTRNLKDLNTDQDLANGEGVKTWLEQYLPTSTSKYALFVRQNSDMDIIHSTDSERRELFKKIQDLDFSKEIDTLIVPKIETVKEKIVEVDKNIFALENKKYEIKDYKELPFTEDEYNIKKSKSDKLKAEKSLIEEKQKQKEELEERKSSLENEYNTINSSIVTKNTTKNEYQSFIDNFESEKNNIEEEFKIRKINSENKIKQLEESVENLKKENQDKQVDIDVEIKKIEEEGQKLTEEINSIRLLKLIKFDEESLTKARNDLAELKTKSSIAWKNAKTLESGVCPVCGSTNCGEKHKEFEDEAIILDKQICECEGVIDDLIAKKNDIEEKSKQNEELKEKKNTLSNELIKKQSLINSKREEQKNLNSTFLANQQNYYNQIESEKRILESIDSEKTSKINSAKEKADMYSSQIKIISDEITELENQKKTKENEIKKTEEKINSFEISSFDSSEIENLDNEISEYEMTVAENKTIKEFNESLDELKKKDKEELEKFKEKRHKFEDEQYNLESAKTIMNRDYPNWVIENSIQNIEDDINQFISDVYYKELNVKFDSSRSGIKMTFGKDIPIKRLSGCESALVKIGFISSFNKNLSLNMITLDEPDAPMSENIKNIFYDSLLMMKDKFEQMIIVTHSQKMQSFIQANDSDCNIITL